MLNGCKTYLAALAAFLVALAGIINQYVNGQIIEYQYVVDTLIALSILFLRSGIKKTT